MKKKLLVCTDYFYPHWTGLSKSLYNMLSSVEKDFNITVLTVQYDKKLPRNEVVGKIKVVRSPYIFSLSRAKVSFSLLKEAFIHIRRHDIIFINSPFSMIFAVVICAKIFGKKLLIFHQGDLILPRSSFNQFIERIFDFSTKAACKLADKVSTYTKDYAIHSPVLKSYMKKFAPIIPPIITSSKLKNQNSKLSIRQAQDPEYIEGQLKIQKLRKQYKYLFGFAGRFVQEKGFDILFDAIPKIIEKLPDAHFIFAGQVHMDYEDFFEENRAKFEKVKKYITILGLLKDDELYAFYQMIDYIIIPSRSDCFPIVQAEAMKMGSSSIVANIPGARVLVKETGFGILFEKENAHALAEKTLALVKKGNKIKQFHPNVLKFLDNYKNAEKIKKFIAG